MHIAEGILPLTWAAATTAAAAPFVLGGAKEIKDRAEEDPASKPLMGLMGAAVFAISALPIPVPISGTCSHPTGVGLAAVLIKPLPAAALSGVVLLIQALLMAHGGLTTWGANTLHMGVIGAFVGYGAFHGLRRVGLPLWVGAAAAGALADLATYGATALTMALALHGDSPVGAVAVTIALAFVPTQLPLAVLEAMLTASAIGLIVERRPDVVARLGILVSPEAKGVPAKVWAAMAASFLALLVGASAFMAIEWAGVDEAVVERFAAELGRAPWTPFINIQGDMLLFMFTVGGLLSGLALGYLGRGFFDHRRAAPDAQGERGGEAI